MPLKVRVRNFQSIADAEIEIDGFTVVTGTNNAGKSAMLRAIRGAFTNARGSDFVRLGASHCTVDIMFDDGQTLRWEKGDKGVNNYVINGRSFKKVGHGVPPEARVFGVEPIVVNDVELWPQIAPQVTGVSFLLDQPGAVIAEAVADVGRVNQLTRALKSCESDRRTARGDLKTRRDDAGTLAARREKFDGLDAAVSVLDDLTTRRDRAERTSTAARNLTKLRDRIRQAYEAVERLQGLDMAAEGLPDEDRVGQTVDAQGAVSTVRSLQKRHAQASRSVVALAGLDEAGVLLPSDERVTHVEKFRQALGITVTLSMRLEEAQKELSQAREADAVVSRLSLDDGPADKADRMKRALSKMRDLARRLSQVRQEVTTLDAETARLEGEHGVIDARAREILGSYEECPTCGKILGSA